MYAQEVRKANISQIYLRGDGAVEVLALSLAARLTCGLQTAEQEPGTNLLHLLQETANPSHQQ